MKKIDRRGFLKVLGFAGVACAMTALTGCDKSSSAVVGDGSVPLSRLEPLNGKIEWGNITPEDPYGNICAQGANYSVLRWWIDKSPVEYYVAKKYKRLTFKLNPYKYTGKNSWDYGKIKIYIGDELVKVSPEITQKTTKTVNVEVDITGAEFIKIDPVLTIGETGTSIILWDAKLWP